MAGERSGAAGQEPEGAGEGPGTAERAGVGGGAGEGRGEVTLKQLAEHLRLSPAAVSRVLNGAPAARSIPQATQERIQAAAREMRYRPNVFARSLRNRRSGTIGVLVPEMSEGYATLVLSGIEERLLQAEYFYLMVSHRHLSAAIERAQTMLLQRAVEGLIAIDTPLPGPCPVPAVAVSGQRQPAGCAQIELNHRRAAELALGHLRALGHERLAFIKGQPFSSDTECRWRGIEEMAAELGVRIEPEMVAELEGDDPSHDAGYRATQALLGRVGAGGGVGFTALFAFNDVSAIGAVRALREAGLRVPEDVSVVGFDDVRSAAYQNPGLTTVRQPLESMGSLAAEIVLEEIARGDGRGAAARRVVVDPELVVRGSTAERRLSTLAG